VCEGAGMREVMSPPIMVRCKCTWRTCVRGLVKLSSMLEAVQLSIVFEMMICLGNVFGKWFVVNVLGS
jgi:hypothetical protein